MDKVIKQLDENTSREQQKEVISGIRKVYKIISKIFVYLMTIFLVIVVFMFVAYFIDMGINAKNHNSKQPLFNAYVIVSPSMEPNIKINDAVVIKRTDKDKLKKGDIITFTSSDSRYYGLTITHRINEIKKLKNGDVLFRTKGDNNNTVDASLVTYDNVYGKVIFKIPMIGYIQSILKTPYGWLFLVIIPCLSIIIYDFTKILRVVNGNSSVKKKEKKIIPKEEIIGYSENNNVKNNTLIEKGKENIDSEII